eukprot:gnl/TRDRNA2_/TRDRNA2_202017_c0_seq1.p1 gnl/TRDRNA2_/TRDRNA2_202017_c0~~gnl/TRDRNA2_/TRDRNA2_202017_c0_seq1.p1  ORF type:complete len:141 (-),score=38.81 gnl/TRDRNA2_/TRDRNA2_202017_c0_seq1:44-466(-)
MAALVREAERRMCEIKTQARALSAWAFATMQVADEKLSAAFGLTTEQELCEASTSSLANLTWGLATMKFTDESFFLVLTRVAERRASEFSKHDLETTASALMQEGYSSQTLLAELKENYQAADRRSQSGTGCHVTRKPVV